MIIETSLACLWGFRFVLHCVSGNPGLSDKRHLTFLLSGGPWMCLASSKRKRETEFRAWTGFYIAHIAYGESNRARGKKQQILFIIECK